MPIITFGNVIEKEMEEARKRFPALSGETPKVRTGSIFGEIDFKSDEPVGNAPPKPKQLPTFKGGIDFKSNAPLEWGIAYPEKQDVWEGLVKPTLKAVVKVPAAILSSFALFPSMGIAPLVSAGVRISSDPSKPLFEFGAGWKGVEETYNMLANIPAKLVTTPEEVEALQTIALAMKPFEWAGKGGGWVGRKATEGLKALGIPDLYLEPLYAFYGEALAVFGLPRLIGGLSSSAWYRSLAIKERGLVVQSLAEAMKNNPNLTEGELLRTYNNPAWRAEALAKRSVVDDYAKVKNYAAAKSREATIERTLKVKKSSPPRPKAEIKPTDVVPEFEFVSKKGNRYEKIGDVWYDSTGKEVTNSFKLSAAEKGKVKYSVKPAEEPISPEVVEPEEVRSKIEQTVEEPPAPVVKPEVVPAPAEEPKPTIPEEEITDDLALIKAIEDRFGRPISKVSDAEIEKFYTDLYDTPERLEREFRNPDPTVMNRTKPFNQVDNPDSLIARIEAEVNSWIDGNDKVDIDSIRDLVTRLREDFVKWSETGESPSGLFSGMNLGELENMKEYFGRLEKWMQGVDSLKIEQTIPAAPVKEPTAVPEAKPKVEWFGEEEGGPSLLSGLMPVDEAARTFKKAYRKIKGKIIKSVNTDQSKIISNIATLHTGGKFDADMTYSKGIMWRGTGIEPKFKYDKRAEVEGVTQADITEGLPLGDNSIESIMFDPPFLVKSKPERAGIMGKRFTVFRSVDELWRFYKQGIDEAFRVLKPGGKLVTKTQDITIGKGIFASSSEIYNFAIQAGFRPIDRFIYKSKKPILMAPNIKVQRHARKVHSDFWVFEKPIRPYAYPEEGGVKLYGGFSIPEMSRSIKDIYEKITGKKKSNVIAMPPPDPFYGIKVEAKNIIRTRRASLDIASYDTNRFVNIIEQQTNARQREVMPFVIEGTEVPKELGRQDLEKVLAKDKAKLEPIAQQVKDHFDIGWMKIKAYLPDLTVKQIQDYVTHLWDVPRHLTAEAVSWFSTQNRFLEKRFVDTYAEGIKLGLKPKTLDISEIIRVHDNVTNRAIENAKYIDNILAMERDGIPLATRTDSPQLGWVEANYPALTRRIPLKKGQVKKKGGFVKTVRLWVHPDLVRPLKVIFEERFDHPVVSAYEALNGVMKKSILSLSLFHHGALFETATATGIPLKALNLYFNPAKIYKALVRGEFPVFENEAMARDAIANGVQFGATADVPVARIQKYLRDLVAATENIPVARRLARVLEGFNSAWDKGLWTYIHDSLKLYAYESEVAKLDPNMDAVTTSLAKKEIGQFVNDTFGGQKWDLLGFTPKEVQMMTWTLLSSDWTLSTTRQALAPTGIGKIYNQTAGLRKALGWKFWIRAALFFGIGMNMLNAFFRKRDMDKNPQYYEKRDYDWYDLTMYGNTMGKKTNLFVGRYKDGSERYVRWGKQFRDFFELLTNPLKKIGGKIAPVPQLISEMFTGHTMSGYRNDDIYGKEGLDRVLGILKTITKSPIPISIKRLMNDKLEFKPLDVVMQSGKGMSRYQATEYFKKAIIDGDEELLKEVYVGALKNNLPAFTLFGYGLAWAESEVATEVTKDLETIADVKAKMAVARTPRERAILDKRLGRLMMEQADKERGLRLLRTALKRAKMMGNVGTKSSVPRLPH